MCAATGERGGLRDQSPEAARRLARARPARDGRRRADSDVRLARVQFTVRHFASAVTYTATNWLEKNRGQLRVELLESDLARLLRQRLKSAFEGDTTFMDAGMVVSAKVQSRKISIAEEETDGGERERRGTTNKRSSAVRTRANSSVGEGVSPVAGRTHQTSAANVVDPERTRRETMRL